METETAAADKINQAPGIRHWLFQVVPPLLMFSVLLTTTSGTSLVFVAGFLLLPVLVSLISIIVKLIFFKKKKYYLLRPLLTIAVFILLIAIANWAYKIALVQAIDEARIIHQLCNEKMSCPDNPVGWQVDGTSIRKNDLGFWLKYIALYRYDEESFKIRVYKAPDLGNIISGGVNRPFNVGPYIEGKN